MEGRKRKFGIITIGYNRLDSLHRLLHFLQIANYNGEDVTLIISLDYQKTSAIREMAKNFNWTHGKKILCFKEKQLGLREHVLQCGNYVNEYDLDAVVVFEDDIVPAWDYFTYVQQAVSRFEEDEYVAGIALYSHRWNTNAWKEFEPARSQYDNFFIQYACSWGQVWTRKQWNDFYAWYLKNLETSFDEIDIPKNVSDWPNTSWLKYHIKYCIEKKKYFVYPYVSLSTNFHEKGTHAKETMNLFQVPILEGAKREYFWGGIEEAVKYDAFFERIGLGEKIGVKEEELCTDLYGMQTAHRNCRYWLTSQKEDYKICHEYANYLKVIEENIVNELEGNGLYLYDTSIKKVNQWNDIEKILQVAKVDETNKGIVLVGAGKYGVYCLEKLKQEGIEVLCFVDEDGHKIGKEMCGKKILSYGELKIIKEKIKIYISVMSEKTKLDVECKLIELGLEDKIVNIPYRI